jgi:hypothetical protein
VAQLVEALRYEHEGPNPITVCAIWIFHWRNPSDRTMALESTHPVTEMSTRNISCGVMAVGA